ncbi:hypothetical protein NQ318_021868 [Aromia moschata]|uniref:DUF4817 domain-containing protein n=1 Tax=Aromia moschata TaxID=1265417 RepID=A0AAV8Z6L4_9CUCU|nr:hypothetical protein NQ318_021868 [Aromia moschata]
MADMYLVYGWCNSNSSAAVRRYRQEFPNRRTPSRKMFDNIDRRLRDTGTFYKTNRNAGRQRFARNVNVEERVLNRVWEDPTLSTRRDESCFTKCGVFNLRNHHEWADANPRATVTRHSQFRFKINYWVGILGNNVIGAVELPRWRCTTLCVASSAMVGGKLPRKMNWAGCPQVPNSTPLHNFGLPVAPDLNPLDFYLWGELKQSVYSRQALNIDDLREIVNKNILRIKLPVDVLKKLRLNFLKRIRACIPANGGHFEQFPK